jgi:hypothetical protein
MSPTLPAAVVARRRPPAVAVVRATSPDTVSSDHVNVGIT